MRFNTRKRSLNERSLEGKYNPSEWTLVQHVDHNSGAAGSAIINITSQDDQLCFTWSLDHQKPIEGRRESLSGSLSSGRRESDDLDEKNVYMLLNYRRRKSLQQSIHPESILLLDLCYYGITQRYLRQSYRWCFNTFSLDTLTGGHSISSLLMFLFNEYNFIDTFHLDQINVLKCFYYLENGYHDSNPYHNSVHAADVTQAMHCFLQEGAIRKHLTPIEAMCALLAAVSHDLDHPGVNQNFLVATKSHLASLYNNLSVLESHHWRFALSCFHESHIFDHFNSDQWRQIEFLLRHLIMATDISRQGEYIQQFREHVKPESKFTMENDEHKYFILQVALKCADLGNPCRPWKISQKWSVHICNEFFRQGDFERQLNIPITPICDRKTMTIPKIQTEFFKNIVRPLFELWNQFLDSKLSRQLISNLNFNDFMWNTMEVESKSGTKRNKVRIGKRSSSVSSVSANGDKLDRIKRTKSLMHLSTSSLSSLDRIGVLVEKSTVTNTNGIMNGTSRKCVGSHKCANGCNTPPVSSIGRQEDKSVASNDDKSSSKADDDEEDDFITDRFNDDCGAILSTPALLLPNYYKDKSYYSFARRGSAPGCIDIRKNELNITKTATLFLLRNSRKANTGTNKRRSSFPASKNLHSLANALQGSVAITQHGIKLPGKCRGRSLDLNNTHKSMKCCKPLYYGASVTTGNGGNGGNKYRSKNFDDHFRFQRASLYDVSKTTAHPPNIQVLLSQNVANQRRRSVPQDILIRSLNNYTA